MARIEQEEIDALRNQADIVNVISHYIKVERYGKSYKAICPFHNDHDPSLLITPEKKIYKCFVCGNGGNVFTFVQNYDKVSFVEAVAKVAELTGFHLSTNPTQTPITKDPHKEKYYQVLNEAIVYTTYQLDTDDSIHAKQYLEERGLDHNIRKVFQIGYDPSKDALTRYLLAKGYEEKDLVGVNVSRVNETGIQDVFRERITFPIHDMNGNPIGFSARSMNPENPSKYINTNETDIFIKGDIVYNLHRAKQEARRQKEIFLCEGVTDVIAFYKADIQNAVCTLGTACTQRQLSLLKKCAPKIVFCYDGDNAGQRATYKAAKLAQTLGIDVAIVQNKTGKDPDEIIRSSGKEGLQNLVQNQITWMEFVLEYYASNTNLQSYMDKKEMIQKLQEEYELLTDELDRKVFIERLSEITKLPIPYANEQRKPIVSEPIRKLVVPDGTKKAQEMILSMMMKSYKASEKFEEELGYLIGEDYNSLSMMIIDQYHQFGKINVGQLIDMSNRQETRDLITKIVSNEEYDLEYDAEKMQGAMRKIKIEVLSSTASQYKQQIQNAMNPESLTLLISKYNECLQEQRRLMNEENQQNNSSQ